MNINRQVKVSTVEEIPPTEPERMVRRRRILGVIIIIAIICVAAIYLGTRPPEVTPPEVTYKIYGYVKTDGVAVAGATVTLDGQSATTDSSGYYEFIGLEGDESYSLSVTKSGYESHSETVQLGVEDKQVSEITLKEVGVEMPLTEITNALASREGVSAENVELYFCVRAAENDNFAVGAVVSEQNSIVFIYDNRTGGITVENEYTATTSDELQAMSIIVSKKPTSPYAEDHLGHLNVNKIVPFNFVKTDSTYTFDYYDGWKGIYIPGWGFGNAIIDADNNVSILTHGWIL